MESIDSNKNSLRKPIKRRSQSRRVHQECIVNVAEARREIVKALNHHRSSSSSSSCGCGVTSVEKRRGTRCTLSIEPQYSSVMDPLPLPQPTWSTTSPTTHPTTPMEVHEFEWGDNIASYTWWLGFLKALDGGHEEATMYPFDEEIGMGFVGLFNKCLGPSMEEVVVDDQSSVPDEWLALPTDGGDCR